MTDGTAPADRPEDAWAERRTSFGNAAADYAAGRPHYPREAIEWTLPAGARTVLDLGAGTGILTKDLLELALDVIAVEPLPEMRALIPTEATALAGTAEAIPVADASVDLVISGQAWHWFDIAAAVAEARRVLRPGGRLAQLWNLLDTSDPLTRQITEVIDAEERTDGAVLSRAEPPYDAGERFTAPEQLLLPHVQGYDAERAIAFAVSRSQAIRLGSEEREAMVEQLRAVVPDGSFTINWWCEAWRSTAR